MIIFTKKGQKNLIQYLFAYEKGVWVFPFYGDETYVDPFDGSTWVWDGVTNTVDEILGVTQDDGRRLRVVESLPECEALDGSFFWDDANGRLYVHWFESIDYHAINTEVANYSEIVAGYANDYNDNTDNVYDGVFYDPIITNIDGLSKNVDLSKLGLVTFDTSTYTLADEPNVFYEQSGIDSVGNPTWFYLIDENDTELTNDKRIFTGIDDGYTHNRSALKTTVQENRFFQNVSICPNVLSVDDWPDAGDEEGSIIPVAWGKIRRGIVLVANIDALTQAGTETAIFIVADSSLDSILSIDNIYDKTGEVFAGGLTVDLSACTVSFTKPSGVAPNDLKEWTWEGQGYDIDGDYNNGLDIIRDAYLKLLSLPFIDSIYDTMIWSQETLKNNASIGISIQSDKGFVEELIEPITTSLQTIIEILGNGKISAASRDTSEIPIDDILIFKSWDQVSIPEIELTAQDTVSELFMTYAPNFKNDEDKLTLLYDVNRLEVLTNYTIDRRDPLSPVDTVLTEESDVLDLGAELMETSSSPNRNITGQMTSLLPNDIRFFDIIGIDTGILDSENIEYGELLQSNPDYNRTYQGIKIRTIPGYQPLLYVQGRGFSSGPDGMSYGFSNEPINGISNGYGITTYT